MPNLVTNVQQTVIVIEFGDNSILDQLQIESIETELLSIADRSSSARILIDLENVEFISSAMIGVFIRFKVRVAKSKSELKLCSASTELQELLKVTKLDSVFDIHENRKTAIESFQAVTR